MTAAGVVLLVTLSVAAASVICWFAVAVAVRRARPPASSDGRPSREVHD